MRSHLFKVAAASCAAVALIVLFRILPVAAWLQCFIDRVARLGWLGVFLYVVVYIVAAVALAPGSVLTLGAGAIFGVVRGTIIVSVAATLGAAAAFLVGRYLARERVERWAAQNEKFALLDRAVGREGWKIVLLTRLSPLFPYNLLNYFYGLTAVPFWPYVIATYIGMLPVTVLYVYLGFAGRLAAEAAAGHQSTPARYLLWLVGLGATAGVTFFATRLARKALSEPQA